MGEQVRREDKMPKERQKDYAKNVPMPKELHGRLEAYAAASYQTSAAVVRIALGAYLAEHGWPRVDS